MGEGMKYIRSEFWWCKEFSVVRIYRDKEWFKRALVILGRFWNEEVLPCKKNGYEHLLTKPKDAKGNCSIIQKSDLELFFSKNKDDPAVIYYADPKKMCGKYLFRRDGSKYVLDKETIGYHDDDNDCKKQKVPVKKPVYKSKPRFTFSNTVTSKIKSKR